MNVSLTPALERFVSGKVASGRYNSASEVVREALRLLEEQDNQRATRLEAFHRELKRRITSLDQGEKIGPDAARTRFKKKSETRRKKSA
ncbi:MAG TPA: type II toxin-antitoxin system ParD family antitoxin [Pseudacidobacterium sp.]|nr:type II toxin-antitoxin system ParD family antitoxin [Pseudacidobacterium sp.]